MENDLKAILEECVTFIYDLKESSLTETEKESREMIVVKALSLGVPVPGFDLVQDNPSFCAESLSSTCQELDNPWDRPKQAPSSSNDHNVGRGSWDSCFDSESSIQSGTVDDNLGVLDDRLILHLNSRQDQSVTSDAYHIPFYPPPNQGFVNPTWVHPQGFPPSQGLYPQVPKDSFFLPHEQYNSSLISGTRNTPDIAKLDVDFPTKGQGALDFSSGPKEHDLTWQAQTQSTKSRSPPRQELPKTESLPLPPAPAPAPAPQLAPTDPGPGPLIDFDASCDHGNISDDQEVTKAKRKGIKPSKSLAVSQDAQFNMDELKSAMQRRASKKEKGDTPKLSRTNTEDVADLEDRARALRESSRTTPSDMERTKSTSDQGKQEVSKAKHKGIKSSTSAAESQDAQFNMDELKSAMQRHASKKKKRDTPKLSRTNTEDIADLEDRARALRESSRTTPLAVEGSNTASDHGQDRVDTELMSALQRRASKMGRESVANEQSSRSIPEAGAGIGSNGSSATSSAHTSSLTQTEIKLAKELQDMQQRSRTKKKRESRVSDVANTRTDAEGTSDQCKSAFESTSNRNGHLEVATGARSKVRATKSSPNLAESKTSKGDPTGASVVVPPIPGPKPLLPKRPDLNGLSQTQNVQTKSKKGQRRTEIFMQGKVAIPLNTDDQDEMDAIPLPSQRVLNAPQIVQPEAQPPVPRSATLQHSRIPPPPPPPPTPLIDPNDVTMRRAFTLPRVKKPPTSKPTPAPSLQQILIDKVNTLHANRDALSTSDEDEENGEIDESEWNC